MISTPSPALGATLLDDKIAFQICDCLSVHELCQCAEASRAWFAVADSDTVWKWRCNECWLEGPPKPPLAVSSPWKAAYYISEKQTLHYSDLSQGNFRDSISSKRILLPDGAVVCASGSFHRNESPGNLFDSSMASKWYTWNFGGRYFRSNEVPIGTRHWVTYAPRRPLRVAAYVFTAANDCPHRDPSDWVLEGRCRGKPWHLLDSQCDQRWGQRFSKVRYLLQHACSEPVDELRFRFFATCGGGSGSKLQIGGCEFETGQLVLTVYARRDGTDNLSLSFINLAGKQVANVEDVSGGRPVKELRLRLSEDLLVDSEGLRLILPDGRMLAESDDDKPVSTLLDCA